MSKKGRKMTGNTDAMKELSDLIKTLKAEVGELRKKVEEKNKRPESENLADLAAALMPLCGMMMPMGFGGSLFPLGLRMGAGRASALGHALERAAEVSSRLGKERDGSAGMADFMQHFLKSSLTSEEKRKVAEAMAIYWKAAASGRPPGPIDPD